MSDLLFPSETRSGTRVSRKHWNWTREEIQAAKYDATQRPIRTTSVGLVDKAPNPECKLRIDTRPDGFSQARIDEIKAAMLASGRRK